MLKALGSNTYELEQQVSLLLADGRCVEGVVRWIVSAEPLTCRISYVEF